MATKRVTINDVAAAAGVSRQTVTRAMNAMPEITPETRERVLQVSEQLGYRPSRFASNLARQKHHSVGLVVATLRNPYYTDLAADMLDVAADRGWQTTIATSDRAHGIELVTELSPHVDAIVGYFPHEAADPEEALVRAARGVPIVFIERHASLAGVHSVALDFATGLKDLVRELRARGARRIAMIDSGVDHSPRTQRGAAFATIASDAPVYRAEETVAGAGRAFVQLRQEHPEVDTVVVFNDLMAMGVMQTAHALGLSVPGDVRIVGIDGLSLGEVMFPPLSTLSIDRQAIAHAAADIVAECFLGTVNASSSRVIIPRPIWRRSA